MAQRLEEILDDFLAHFERIFVVDGNGALKYSNALIDNVNEFVSTYALLFDDICIRKIRLTPIGQSQVHLARPNKKKLVTLFSLLGYTYFKTCLKRGRDPIYEGITIPDAPNDVKIEFDY